MDIRKVLETVVIALLLLIAIAVVAGQLLGYPFLIGYVETASMEPTLNVGDGFIALPTWVGGGVSEGDVVTYDAQHLDDGGMTTHRIMEETPEGYITRGDGNPFTDQEAGEPPVQDSQIQATALQIGTTTIAIPYVGHIIGFLQGALGAITGVFGFVAPTSPQFVSITIILGVGLIVVGLLSGLLESKRRRIGRSVGRDGLVHSSYVLVILLLAIGLPLMVGMSLPSGTDDVTILSATTPDSDPTVILAGQTDETTYEVENTQVIPSIVVLEAQSTGVTFEESVLHIPSGGTAETTLRMSAPEDTGLYVRSRSEYHYPHVLPTSVLLSLHDIHPFIARLGVCFVFFLPISILFGLFVGFRPISVRPVHD